MALKNSVKRTQSFTVDLKTMVICCTASFIFGGLAVAMGHPTLQEIDKLKKQCFMNYHVYSSDDCTVKITVEPKYTFQEYH